MRFTLFALTLASTSACLAQAPRWRYVEVASPSAENKLALTRVNDKGEFAGAILGPANSTQVFYKPSSGFVVVPTIPNPNGPGSLRFSGSVFTNDSRFLGIGLSTSGNSRTLLSWTPGQNLEILNRNIPVGDLVVMNGSGHAAMQFTHPITGVPNTGRYSVPGPNQPTWVAGGVGASFINFAAMNESGLLVGAAGGTGNWSTDYTRPAMWTNQGQTLTMLQSPNQLYGNALDVSENGQIFGIVSKNGPNPGWYGVWWDSAGSVQRELFLYPESQFGNLSSDPMGNSPGSSHLREDGSIIFRRMISGDGAYPKYWSPLTGEIDLNSSIDGLPSGFKLRRITDSNAAGQMVGYIESTLEQRYNFYLEPVPEPATLAALGVGLVALLRRGRGGRAG